MRSTGRLNRGAVHRLVVIMAAAVIVVLVAACGGGSGSRSSADPAAIVPANVPLYVSVEVPTDGQVSQFHQLVTKFAGAKAWTMISNGFNRELAKNKTSWKKDVEPWIGSQAGFAFENFAAVSADDGNGLNGLVLIFPTNNIKAALAFAKKNNSPGQVAEQDGSDMIVSNAATLAQFKAASGGKLSSSSGYTAVQKGVSGDNAVIYGAVHSLANEIISASSSGTTSASVTSALAKIPADATVGVGVALTPQSARIDVIPHDLPANSAGTTGGAGTVAGLPASSILAAALNITLPKNNSFVKEFTKGLSEGISSGIPGTGELARGESIIDTVLPALGPLTLSFGGSTLLNLQAGLTLAPSSASAGTKLVKLLYNEISSSPEVQVKGTAQSFSLGAGPFSVKVADHAGKVLALLGYANANALLHPASTLSSNATYKSAVSALPSGAKVPFYLSFKGLNTLLGAIPTSQIAQARKVLGKLSYLIIGSAPGDFRIVLGLS